MKLENKNLAALVEAANIPELERRIHYAESLDGLTELEWLQREAEWLVEDYAEDTGHLLHDELKWAKRLLKETDGGKRIPIDPMNGFRPKEGYGPHDIEEARQTVAEYKAAKAFARKVKAI